MQATVEDLDFSPERGLERRLVLELSQCNWVDQALNILVSGATGTGKKFRGLFIGYRCDPPGIFRALFPYGPFSASLTRARQEGSYLNLLRSLSRTDVLILDDWMRDPIPLSAAQDLLEVFDDRFGKSATIIAAQVPVSAWHARFQTLLWRTLSWIVRSTMPINFPYSAILKESYGQPAPCHTPEPPAMSILCNYPASLIASAFMKTCFGISCGTALGARKIPGGLWKSGQNSTAHFPTATTTTSPQNQSCSLRSACYIHTKWQLVLFPTGTPADPQRKLPGFRTMPHT